MCELHGFTDARTGFARLVHAEATAIAALNSLMHFAQRCSTASEVVAEIRERMALKVQALGLAPDVISDQLECVVAAGGIRVLDRVRDAAGTEGTVTMLLDTAEAPRALVAFDLPGGTLGLVRKCEALELVARGAA